MNYKLSLACLHILNCKTPILIENDEKPLHSQDSGKTYVCEECFKEPDINKVRFKFFYQDYIRTKFH